MPYFLLKECWSRSYFLSGPITNMTSIEVYIDNNRCKLFCCFLYYLWKNMYLPSSILVVNWSGRHSTGEGEVRGNCWLETHDNTSSRGCISRKFKSPLQKTQSKFCVTSVNLMKYKHKWDPQKMEIMRDER